MGSQKEGECQREWERMLKELYIGYLFLICYQLQVKVKVKATADIQYKVFRLSGYPAGRISGKISIRCTPILEVLFQPSSLSNRSAAFYQWLIEALRSISGESKRCVLSMVNKSAAFYQWLMRVQPPSGSNRLADKRLSCASQVQHLEEIHFFNIKST